MPPDSPAAPLLFSVDLEDVRSMIPGGMRYAERVPATIARYLEFLARHDMRCTFFTVGDIARRYPELVREIAAAGHEIACHSSDHRPLPRHDPASFREDLLRNLDDLRSAGAGEICGFRAPVMSLTSEQVWAYEILRELGFRYSSSVLPSGGSLFGWPGFERAAQRRPEGVWELPVTLTGWSRLDVPFACGVFLRVLPFAIVRALCRRERAAGRATVMYCHPYDIDTGQEHFMHPELGDSRLLNELMYLGRGRLMARLDRLVGAFGACVPYRDHVTSLEHSEGAAGGSG